MDALKSEFTSSFIFVYRCGSVLDFLNIFRATIQLFSLMGRLAQVKRIVWRGTSTAKMTKASQWLSWSPVRTKESCHARYDFCLKWSNRRVILEGRSSLSIAATFKSIKKEFTTYWTSRIWRDRSPTGPVSSSSGARTTFRSRICIHSSAARQMTSLPSTILASRTRL